jgi:hypothetical protein
VAGTLRRERGSLVLVAERMEPIERPSNPYGV